MLWMLDSRQSPCVRWMQLLADVPPVLAELIIIVYLIYCKGQFSSVKHFNAFYIFLN